MINQEKATDPVAAITALLSRLESGDLSARLEDGGERGSLGPIIDKVNSLARTLQAQAQAQAQAIQRTAAVESATTLAKDESAMRAAVWEHAPTGLLKLDTNLRITAANPAFCSMMEYSEEELTGRSIPEISHPDDATASTKIGAAIVQAGVATKISKRYITKSGKTLWALVAARKWVGQDDQLQFFATVQDITSLKAAEAAAENTAALIKQSFDAMPLFVSYLNQNGEYQFSNAHYNHFFGPKLDLLRAGKLSALFGTADTAAVEAARKQALSGTTSQVTVTIAANGADEPSTVEARYIPHLDAGGRVVGVVTVAEDISQRLAAQSRLEDSNRELEAIANNLRASQSELTQMVGAIDRVALVAETDTRGVITAANDKFCAISGYTRDELMGKTHAVVNSGFHDKAFFTDLWATIKSGRPWTGEIANRAKDGATYWVQTVITPVWDANGQIQKFVAIRFDVSAEKRRKAEMEHQRALIISSSKMASLGEMAGGVAHEINNPLAIISGNAWRLEKELTADAPDLTRARESVAVVADMTKRIAKIVRALHTFARDGSADLPEETSVQSLMSQVEALCTERFKAHGVALSIVFPDCPLELSCRTVQISQILVNLLNNAFDAVSEQPSGAGRWVRLEVAAVTGAVTIAVTDSGGGIPAAVAGKIFDPFFTTKPVGKGTGLGLSISASIAKDHGGTLILDQTGPNTRFVLTLPRAQAVVGAA